MVDSFEVHQLTKHYGKTVALDQLDLRVGEGEVFGLLGPNGAGKTTFIRLLLGLLKPTKGSAVIFGQSCWASPAVVHKDVAYVPGDFVVWPHLTGLEMLRLLSATRANSDKDYETELIKRFEFDVNRKGRTYSKGNKQKTILISALASRAKLLILDEPTSGLDPLMEQVFQECVHEAKSNGQTILLSSHILSEVEATCDRVGILRKGTLVEEGTIGSLAKLHSVSMKCSFARSAPDLSGVVGLVELRRSSNWIEFSYSGDVSQLLEKLSSYEVTEILSERPSLEQLFLSHYSENR